MELPAPSRGGQFCCGRKRVGLLHRKPLKGQVQARRPRGNQVGRLKGGDRYQSTRDQLRIAGEGDHAHLNYLAGKGILGDFALKLLQSLTHRLDGRAPMLPEVSSSR
jgi:hypothetical protein